MINGQFQITGFARENKNAQKLLKSVQSHRTGQELPLLSQPSALQGCTQLLNFLNFRVLRLYQSYSTCTVSSMHIPAYLGVLGCFFFNNTC